jgi:hypothetical protein
LVQVSSGELGVPLWPHDWGFAGFFWKLGSMIFDVELVVLPSRNVGGEFIGKVPIADLQSKLDAGAPYNGQILGCGLRFYSEKEAKKIPMGFDSEEGFTEMDEDCDMANRIRVEMMELKPLEIKKATEKRSRGEGQTPFGKMVKCDDFIYTYHGERFAKRGAPVDKTLVLEQSLGNKLIEVVEGVLTVCPLPRWQLRLLLLPILLRSLGRHFHIRSPRVTRGLRGKGWGDFGWIGALQEGEGGVRLYLGILGSSWRIADWKHSFSLALPRG